jgi:pilus assembly protein Flp/PilA
MRDFILMTLIRLRHNDDGVTLVEYGIAVALAVILGTGALTALANEIGGAMNAAGNEMPGVAIVP